MAKGSNGILKILQGGQGGHFSSGLHGLQEPVQRKNDIKLIIIITINITILLQSGFRNCLSVMKSRII